MAKTKLLMSWDIKPNLEQEYFEFVIREFVPGITKLGIEPTDAWYTLYGDCSQILTAGTTDSAAGLFSILQSDEWSELKQKLLEFVDNLEQKVVPATSGFQL
ncbi:MAG: hypothetical protein ACE5FI_00405 [Anaerolineales bacterium]